MVRNTRAQLYVGVDGSALTADRVLITETGRGFAGGGRGLSLEDGTAARVPQDHANATHSPKLTREDGRIDWSRPAEAVARTVRAYDPWPGTFTRWTSPGEKEIKLKIFPKGAALPTTPRTRRAPSGRSRRPSSMLGYSPRARPRTPLSRSPTR